MHVLNPIKVLLIFLALLNFIEVDAQEKKYLTRLRSGILNVGFGIGRNSLYKKPFNTPQSTDSFFTHKAQNGITLLDLSVSYTIPLRSGNLSPVFGFVFQPTGFIESGTLESDSSSRSYRFSYTHNFVGISGGISYPLFKKDKLKIHFQQLVNATTAIVSADELKKVVFSTRTAMLFTIPFKSERQFSFVPFFQTSLTKYNSGSGVAYFPYSYGIQIASFLNL
ncbi:MAG: hypothetical protein H6605_02055 [Flavobacteriales bacterium]|nr:hypothetical protein [Flavobacteriales bacterium]